MNSPEKTEQTIASILQIILDQGIQSDWELSFKDLNLPAEFAPFYIGGINWLVREGIVVANEATEFMGDRDLVVLAPSLTSKGYALIGKKINIGGAETTLGNEVERRSSGIGAASSLGDFLGGFFGGFTKSIGS